MTKNDRKKKVSSKPKTWYVWKQLLNNKKKLI